MSDDSRPGIRSQPLLALAAGCACVLVAVLGLEYHSGVKREMRLAYPLSAAAGPGPALDPAVLSQVSQAAGHVESWSRTTLDRPLFSQSRRPAAAASGPQQPRLAGIVLAPSGNRAIFAGAGEARGIVAGVGQQAGGWHVLAIDLDSVRVIGPDGLRTLHPSRDPNRSDDAASANAPALPAHPSILDLLRSRTMQIGPPNEAMPSLPAILRPMPGPPQQ